MKSIFTKEQIEYMKNNYDKMSYLEIAERLGFTERQVRGKINNMGLSKLKKFNDDYFDVIDTVSKAYWLGFIYADGYLVINKSNRNYELGIELNINDVKLLEDFNSEFNNVHRISFKHSCKEFNGYQYETDSCILRIYSKKITDGLLSHNVYPNKTNRKEFPTCDEFFFEFLRGFMDGDGCIHVSKNNHIILKFTNSNIDFLEYLRDVIDTRLNIKGHIYKETDKKYQLTYFRQNDVKIVLDKIYENKDCQFLERKYDVYKSYYGSPA